MLNIKNLTPYLLTLILITISFHYLTFVNNSLLKVVLNEIDQLLTDEKKYINNEYADFDYSSFSNDLICDKVTSIDDYPDQLSHFLDESIRRNLQCYYKTVGYYSTNSSEEFVSNIELPMSRP